MDFLKINYNKALIYLRTIQENHRNFNLSIYDIKSNRLKILDENEKDLSNQFFDFTNSSNSMLVFQNSEQEILSLMSKANKTHNMKLFSPNNKIILKDENGKDEKVYGSIKTVIGNISMSPNKQSTIILTGEVDNHKLEKKILLKGLNNNTNKPKCILKTTGSYQDITKLCFSKDGKGFYFVASETSELYNVYYYNLENKTTLPVLKINDEKIIDCIAMILLNS